MKFRKVIIALSVLTALGMLVSCEKKDESGSSNKSDSTSATSSSASETSSETSTTTAESKADVTTVAESLVEPEKPVVTPDANAITFDNDFYTAKVMGEKDFVGTDESNCNLTIAEYNNSNMLKIEVLDKKDDGSGYKIPKIVFDIDELVGAENVGKIKSFTCDIYGVAVGMFTGEDGVEKLVPSNLMGSFGGNFPHSDDPTKWCQFTDFNGGSWDWDWAYIPYEGKILLEKNRYEAGQEGCTLVFMRWSIANQADVYLDNITFFDDDGNSIPLVYTPAEGADDSSTAE